MSTIYANPGDSLQSKVQSLTPGTTLIVHAGNYSGFSVYGLRGTASAPINIYADAGVNIISKATAQTALDVGIELSGPNASSGCSNINMSGFNVNDSTGTIKGAVSSGIRVRFSDHVTITNCSVSNCGDFGIYAAYVDNVVISDCSSVANNLFVDSSTQRNHGIYVANSSSNVQILRCSVIGNHGNGIHLNGDGGVNSNVTVSENTIIGSGLNGGSAINCDGLQNSLISGNVLENNLNKGIALYYIDATGPSKNDVIENNFVLMAPTSRNDAIQVQNNANVIRNNVFSNALSVAIDNTGSSNTFSNNVIRGASNVKGQIISPIGDANYDGKVTMDDYGTLDANLGTTNPVADLNGDGLVTADDYGVLDANLGS